MTNTLVTMEGMLEPIRVEGDFNFNANGMERASTQGMMFLLTRDPDGVAVGLAMNKIVAIREEDDD